MIDYIKSLLPRLQQFSKSLDYIENFVDKPWVFFDEQQRRHTYIFQRDNSFIMSLNGQVQIGNWKYIPSANRLLIDRGADKILLEHGFIDNGIMVLRIDGNIDNRWILINETEVPDLDANRYIKQSFIRHSKLKTLDVSGKTYYYSDPNNTGFEYNTEFYDEDLNKASLSFKFAAYIGIRHYEVQDGSIHRSYFTRSIKTKAGMVDVIAKNNILSIGDSVSINGRTAPNGYYKASDADIKGFTVEEGKVLRIKDKMDLLLVASITIIGLLLTIFIIAKIIS